MIRLRCSNCEQTLEMDDAFAGGVCRCRYCGTIQTVPKSSIRLPASSTSRTSSARNKPLLRPEDHNRSAGHSASGLEELADVIASSGMISSGLHRTARGPRKPVGRHSDRQKPDLRLILAVGVAAVFALIAAALAITLMTRNATPQAGVGPDSTPEAAEATEFAGLPLGRKVVFLVDRGTQTQGMVRAFNEAVLHTLERLPGTTQFQVIYWARPDPGTGEPRVVALPGPSLRDASRENVESTRQAMEALITGGSTDVVPALEMAVQNSPDTIILATGNAWALDGEFARKVLEGASSAPDVVIHTIALNAQDGQGEPMYQIARETGGRFIGLDDARLRSIAEE